MHRFQAGSGDVCGLRFTPDGRQLVFAEQAPRPPDPCFGGLYVRVEGVIPAFHVLGPDGGHEVLPVREMSLWVEGPGEGEDFFEGPPSEDAVMAALSPDGRHAVTVWDWTGKEHGVGLWDLGARRLLALDVTPTKTNVQGLAFSPDGKLLAVTGGGEYEPFTWIWEVGTGRPLDLRPGLGARPAFSPDGRLLALGGWNGVSIEDLTRPPTEDPWCRCDGAVSALAFAPDGQTVTFAAGTEVRRWRPGGGHAERLCGHRAAIREMAFSPDGNLLALAGRDGTLLLWDVAAGRLAGAFDWGIGEVYSVAFARDGMTAAAGGEGGQVVVWDVEG